MTPAAANANAASERQHKKLTGFSIGNLSCFGYVLNKVGPDLPVPDGDTCNYYRKSRIPAGLIEDILCMSCLIGKVFHSFRAAVARFNF